MIIAAIAFPIGAISLGIAGYVFFRHWKDIRLLDPMTIKEERERRKREEMIARRFERVRADQALPFKKMGRQVYLALQGGYRSLYRRLQRLEQVYSSSKNPLANIAPTARERVKSLLGEARSFMRDLKWADAERRLLEVLALDQRNAEAYKLLGQLYVKQKLYPQAKETFEFLLKLKKADDATYAGLAVIAEADGDVSRAEQMRQKAVEASPRQAFRHAELAQFYVDRGQPALAWASAKRAAELEPSSAKYLELSLEVAILLGDRTEARKRYDRLRLVAQDRSRFQVWREKVEKLEADAPVQALKSRIGLLRRRAGKGEEK